MAKHILVCTKCGSYTMNPKCSCDGEALSPKPPKYSPEDKYGEYRRKVKKQSLIERGII